MGLCPFPRETWVPGNPPPPDFIPGSDLHLRAPARVSAEPWSWTNEHVHRLSCFPENDEDTASSLSNSRTMCA